MIAIVDYGLGNLRSIAKALEYVGADVVVTGQSEQIRQADRIVVPGVGAFGDGMRNLHAFGLVEILTQQVLEEQKPCWGICLGMQLFAKNSEEFGMHAGLGWLDAQVQKIDIPPETAGIKIPHVGWNAVVFHEHHPMCAHIPEQTDFYFVHSYHLVPAKGTAAALGTCDYGATVVACIARANIFATQFHPEKSQKYGLQMLRNFLEWQPVTR